MSLMAYSSNFSPKHMGTSKQNMANGKPLAGLNFNGYVLVSRVSPEARTAVIHAGYHHDVAA